MSHIDRDGNPKNDAYFELQAIVQAKKEFYQIHPSTWVKKLTPHYVRQRREYVTKRVEELMVREGIGC